MDYSEEVKGIGRKIKERRKKNRWTLKELADKAGCSESYIHKIENGKRTPSLEMLLEISNAFNVKLETLIRG